MAPRIILYTGKGGVGKTSVAAATALRTARAGQRTVILSTDPAHSLSDSLETALGSQPTAIRENLYGQQVQAQEELERHWRSVQEWFTQFLSERGVNNIAAEELSVPPGMDEFFSLLQIKAHHESGRWDTVVVDCAPTGETLRLLSFPEVAQWWLERVFPWEKRMVAAARPFARAFLDLNLPSEDVFSDVQRLVRNLIAMNEILRNRKHTSIRLVMNPDRMVINEAQRTFTYLNLYGYLTDAVIVNRVFPESVAGGYFDQWRLKQQEHVELVRAAFEPVPVLMAPFFEREVIGEPMLERLGQELFADRAAHEVLHSDINHQLSINNGRAELRLAIPFVEKADIDLKKVGLELIVRVSDQKRNIMLPPRLSNYHPIGAKFESDALQVTFEER